MIDVVPSKQNSPHRLIYKITIKNNHISNLLQVYNRNYMYYILNFVNRLKCCLLDVELIFTEKLRIAGTGNTGSYTARRFLTGLYLDYTEYTHVSIDTISCNLHYGSVFL